MTAATLAPADNDGKAAHESDRRAEAESPALARTEAAEKRAAALTAAVREVADEWDAASGTHGRSPWATRLRAVLDAADATALDRRDARVRAAERERIAQSLDRKASDLTHGYGDLAEFYRDAARIARAGALCDHTYPPANCDGTCPSCGKARADAQTSEDGSRT